MKVEVCIVKKPGKKVEVTLAKSKYRRHCIPVPVRVAPKLSDIDDDITLAASENADDIYDVDPVCEDQPDFFFTFEEDPEFPLDEEFLFDGDDAEAEENVSEEINEDIDEDELLALIAEEEAEMAAQQINSPEESSPAGYTARDHADDAADEEYVSELASEVQELVDELGCEDESIDQCYDDSVSAVEAQEIVDEMNLIDEIFDNCDDVLEDGVCTAGEAQELVDELTADFEPDEDSFDKYGGKDDDSSAATEQYMRYFDRSTSGERVEVEDPNATGQEIVCVDGESGKISRVCGFIRHEKNNPLPSVEELISEEN